MQERKLGNGILEVSAIGLGCMGMTFSYGPPIDLLGAIGRRKKATPAQIALTWLLAQKPWIVPIPGTTKPHRLEENIGAALIQLTPDDLREIDRAASQIAVHGGSVSGAVGTPDGPLTRSVTEQHPTLSLVALRPR